jgi:hypothetical protein
MSKITDCFLKDNTSGAYIAVYDAAEDGPTYFASRHGISSQTGSPRISVPFFPFTDVEVEDRCVLLLLQAIKGVGPRLANPYEDAEWEFKKRDHKLHRVITSSDHHLIPQGMRIAVAEPEQVGNIIVSDLQRGVVLFNRDAVIGYKWQGVTAYQRVLSDYLAA